MRLRFVADLAAGAPFDPDAGGAGSAPLAPVFTYAPPGSTPIAARDRGDVTGVNAVLSLLSGAIPPGNVGVIKRLGFVVNGPTVDTEIRFRLLVNGTPVQGLNDLALFGRAGAASLEDETPELTVMLAERATWELVAVDVDGALYTVEAYATGWYMPRELAGNA